VDAAANNVPAVKSNAMTREIPRADMPRERRQYQLLSVVRARRGPPEADMRKLLIGVVFVGISASIGTKIHAQPTSVPLSNASVFDSEIYRELFTTQEMRDVFSDARLIAYWLKFEVELAAVQASLGVIPVEAAQAIAKAAQPENIDITKLRARTNQAGRAIEPLLSQITAVGDKHVKDFLHWGGTTQDTMDTATVLQIRDGLVIIRRDLQKLVVVLADKATRYRATPMVARTLGQDAAPTTFGMLLASYMTELRRHLDRLDAATERVLVGQYGSAVGTLSSAGPEGLKVRAALMKKLGLREPDLSWNASRDNYAEIVQTLALVHGTMNRIAVDINLWSRTADNAVNEGEGSGSSTMPQKRNPRASEFMSGLAYLAKMRAAGALSMLDQSETRQGAPWISEWSTIPEMFMLTAATLELANGLFAKLIVRPEVMLEEFNHSKGFVMAEAVMMHIAPKIGREPALNLIKDAIKAAPSDASFKEVVQKSPKLLELVGAAQVDNVLNPSNYLGAAIAMIDTAVTKARTGLR
jgi:3-carboxy-cis,cis-muconate cycloisomerase